MIVDNENFSREYYQCPNSEPSERQEWRRIPKGTAAMVSRGLSLGREGEARAGWRAWEGGGAQDVRLTFNLEGHGWPLVLCAG